MWRAALVVKKQPAFGRLRALRLFKCTSIRSLKLKPVGPVIEQLQSVWFIRAVGKTHRSEAARPNRDDVGGFELQEVLQYGADHTAVADGQKVRARHSALCVDHSAYAINKAVPRLAARRRLGISGADPLGGLVIARSLHEVHKGIKPGLDGFLVERRSRRFGLPMAPHSAEAQPSARTGREVSDMACQTQMAAKKASIDDKPALLIGLAHRHGIAA